MWKPWRAEPRVSINQIREKEDLSRNVAFRKSDEQTRYYSRLYSLKL